MGEFFDPGPQQPHRCELPDTGQTPAGKGWRCDCGKAFVLVTVSQHGETRPQWRRTPPHDRGADW